jgi:hypothetical protein
VEGVATAIREAARRGHRRTDEEAAVAERFSEEVLAGRLVGLLEGLDQTAEALRPQG